ncbi:unnamed protein product [Symbiodinium natans]|uniref:Uncharacterized protein n=1 Tax=Symbiodinium natans TaxID=878477 RepID=A0A812KIP1_9DINO|nr:unnamed protein product [Symbiodinium natans]
MPALPVLCREVLAETLRDSVVPRDAVQADVLESFHFDGFLTLAAMRALMMLFFLLAVITMALWRILEVGETDPEPDDTCQKSEFQQQATIAIDKLLTEERAAEDLPEISLQGLPTDFPGICPPYMKATQGARLSMALPITERGCDIFGLGASLALRGPPTRLLSANLRLEGPTRVLELREQEPGCCEGAAEGRVLLAITSDMVLWKGPSREGECLGMLKSSPLGGGFLLQRKGYQSDLLVATSGSGRIELGLLPSGRLVASAAVGHGETSLRPRRIVQFASDAHLVALWKLRSVTASQLQSTRHVPHVPLIISILVSVITFHVGENGWSPDMSQDLTAVSNKVKAGIDAVYALGCLLAVVSLNPPKSRLPCASEMQRKQGDAAADQEPSVALVCRGH